MVVDIPDVVTYTNFGDYRLRGFWVAGGRISPSPIDFHRRPYNTLALLCERVIAAPSVIIAVMDLVVVFACLYLCLRCCVFAIATVFSVNKDLHKRNVLNSDSLAHRIR